MTNAPSRTLHWVVWGGLGLTFAALLAAFILQRSQGQEARAGLSSKLPVLFPVPSFALTNQFGQTVSSSNLAGNAWLADIIFTRCEGPCPVMTRRLAELQAGFSP